MRNRHRKIEPWMIVVLVIFLLLFALINISGRGKVSLVENAFGSLMKPIQSVLYKGSNAISNTFRPIRNVFSLDKENQELKNEVLKLKKELISKTMLKEELEELKRLRKAQNYTIKNSINNNITAEIISRDADNFYGMFVINVGYNKGIVKNSMVFNENGLIGQVFESGSGWAKVISIIDSNCSLSFQIVDSKRKYNGVINGVGKDYLEGYFYDETVKASVGDKIMTSGVGIYPKGVVIGVITEINTDNKGLLTKLKVKPFVDFKKINRVIVVPPQDTFKDKKKNEKQ
ncbi:MAG: rod shape-determining protein MreC [Clostridiales bacterium]|nr:MAG: rod shape-determining protein MreC [Clostridiales bacterium]